MYSMVKDWRTKRTNIMFDPSHYSVDNYYTDVHKKEIKHSFGEDLLNNLHLLPDPLKKNLADSIISTEEPKQRPSKKVLNMETVASRVTEVEGEDERPQPQMAALSGITSFFSGVMNVITGAMFQWRPRSPPKYYDCYDESNANRQGSPPSWHSASAEDQNKNERAHDLISNAQTELKSDMNQDCKSAAAQCEDKLNKVRLLLTTKPVETPKYRTRRPRKVFVEPGSVEENFEDAFSPEDFVTLSDESYIEYYSPFQVHQEDLLCTDSPRMRTRVAPVHETTNIVETLPVVENSENNCTAVKIDNLNCESVKTVADNCKSVISVNSEVDEKQINIKLNEHSDTKLETEGVNANVPTVTNTKAGEDSKEELVSSCEDKVSKLKALLQERRKNNTKSITQSSDSAPESVDTTNENVQKHSKTAPIEKTQDKRFKNPCRRTDKRRKTRLRKHIQDDMLFAHEINSEDLSSVENSPSMTSIDERLANRLTSKPPIHPDSKSSLSDSPSCTPKCSVSPVITPKHTATSQSQKDTEFFDEISGRFRSTSTTDSEDSFQIVFNDSPKTRSRIPSDCDSEDSFIVFEDSPDSCYTSNDVFGEESDEDSEYTDSDSDVSDSGCVPLTKFPHNLSRTIGDLTDTSLYDEKCVDEVDCAVSTVCEEIPSDEVDGSEDLSEQIKDTGVMLTTAKKLLRKGQPPKKVQFSSRPPEVHVMRVWAFAARQARAGDWQRYSRDRERFKSRIADVDMAVSWVLKPQHRSRVMFQRFMPWWNAQRRIEIAEKKKKAEEDKRIAEEEKRIAEEEKRIAEEERRLEEERLKLEEESKFDGVNGVDAATDKTELKIVCNGDGKVKLDDNCINGLKQLKQYGINKKTKTRIVLKNGTVIVNGKIVKQGIKKTQADDKIVNCDGNDITLDLNETISGT